ncbi:putative endo-1,3(4)-beta-glucanase [Glarea lozoyensis 74030]|uniref:Putative endo-1,3(4)-beta-glucanase n=1 Tax=Glarea lozoyensis (strain ATCC 74030 / MF5533) TaxID=1104152 RepID=H0EWX1_GLAL7|nr:putative endo-1,3(4)-beta-glucanase [Glarea lozoyensis 74030]
MKKRIRLQDGFLFYFLLAPDSVIYLEHIGIQASPQLRQHKLVPIFRLAHHPSNGFVDYISLPTAQSLGLAKITNNQVFLGVDNTNVIPQGSRGRKAIWLTSKIEFTRGLLIGDFAHIPSSDCGSWPAFWTTNNGESRTVDVPDPEKVLVLQRRHEWSDDVAYGYALALLFDYGGSDL